MLASLNVPTAVNDSLVRGGMVRLDGATAIAAIVALVTSRFTLAPAEFSVAVIVVAPGLTPRARPETELVAIPV